MTLQPRTACTYVINMCSNYSWSNKLVNNDENGSVRVAQGQVGAQTKTPITSTRRAGLIKTKRYAQLLAVVAANVQQEVSIRRMRGNGVVDSSLLQRAVQCQGALQVELEGDE